VARLLCTVLFQIRSGGRSLLPIRGGGIVCSNHQSYLDPIFVGLACDRRLNFLARESLFRWRPFARLLGWYDTIPIQRDGFGLAGMRETLRRLRREELVLVYPEGTRTADGRLRPLKAGICALARRAGVPLIPVAIAGAFEVWPRDRRVPHRGRVAVQFGPPIDVDQLQRLTDEQLLDLLRERLEQCLIRAQQMGSGAVTGSRSDDERARRCPHR
jgi:1-acyl-sn-glycerol-3-phosphate acyltransferase